MAKVSTQSLVEKCSQFIGSIFRLQKNLHAFSVNENTQCGRLFSCPDYRAISIEKRFIWTANIFFQSTEQTENACETSSLFGHRVPSKGK